MAWTTPTARSPGELITSAIWNTQLKDNLLFLNKQEAVRCHRTSAQSIGDATWTAVNWDNENYDHGTHHDTVTNNTRITPAVAGIWVFQAAILFVANATGWRGLRLRLNGGSVYPVWQQLGSLGSSASTGLSVVAPYAMNGSTDYMEVEVYQNSGGNLNMQSATGNMDVFFAGHLVTRT